MSTVIDAPDTIEGIDTSDHNRWVHIVPVADFGPLLDNVKALCGESKPGPVLNAVECTPESICPVCKAAAIRLGLWDGLVR